ncbi:MAG: TlpA disulfide reductase family protein, partial [Thermoanaerobaculia bacterium]
MVALFGIPAAARPADMGELLAGVGLRLVTPPSPATDFDLPRLDGGRGSLSDYRGNWVVLTFWATWCGPCRMEMPSLERLHRERADQGLSVLGVSIDEDQAPIGPFVQQLGLTFPMFWDERREVGAAYRASSIPLSYLIDPTGRIVALSRGARDWSDLGGMLEAALAVVPPDPGAQAVYASGPVELPSTLNPPTAELALSDPEPQVG